MRLEDLNNTMFLKQFVYGLISFIPGVNRWLAKGTGGTGSSRYCYSVWMRHLVMAKTNGLNTYPKVVAELGPGDSLGIGLAALVSGCEKYYAFDVVEHATLEKNIIIFHEIVALFRGKTPIPDAKEFPELKPYLKNYDFPSDIFNDDWLSVALNAERLKKIEDSIHNARSKDSLIQYKVPWSDENIVKEGTVDMIYSQAVLEHVDDLQSTYKIMFSWLKTNGFISHQIDFKCHGTANKWNGHWLYSDNIWKFIRGKRPYLINRMPHSKHLELLQKEQFKLLCDIRIVTKSNIFITNLAEKFRTISDEDLVTSGAFIQAIKYQEIL